MNSIKSIILSLVFTFAFIGLLAQPKDNSPYSRFGLGDPVDTKFVHLRSTGFGGAMYDPYQINIVNPASNGYLQATVFDLGLYAKYSNLSTNNGSSNVYSGNLEYLSLGFPLINPINDLLEKKVRKYDIGLSFTLMPNSNVGFDITSEKDYPNIGKVTRNYKGTGGTYKFLTGIGGRYENFSFGINLGYFFGKINYDKSLIFNEVFSSYKNEYHDDFAVNGFLYNVGAIYNLVLNKNEITVSNNIKPKKIIFGLYGGSKTNFNVKGTKYNRSFIYNSTLSGETVDTVFYNDTIAGKGALPTSFGASILFNNQNKLIIGLDYSRTLWNQYFNEVKDDNLFDSYDISLGVQYTPNESSYTNYFHRIHYRTSLYYKTDPRSEKDNQFNELGIHLGLGLPFVYKRKISRMNVDLNFGKKRGDLSISENFVKLSFSVTFNDTEWFVKRKYY